jgi:hypothetical protein
MPKRLTYGQVLGLVNKNNKSALSDALILCLIWLESAFDVEAVSQTGALGLMQLTSAAVDTVNANTPKGVHFEYNHPTMFNAARNIQCGTHYLRILVRLHHEIDTVLRHYGSAHPTSEQARRYAANILNCQNCALQHPANIEACLHRIHS